MTIKFRFLTLLGLVCLATISTQSQAQKKIPGNILNDLIQRIIYLQKTNKYFNAEILGVFSEKGGDYLQTQKEIENIPNSVENQKLLFTYWYQKHNGFVVVNGEVLDGERRLFNLFSNTFRLNNETAMYLSKYISNQEYVTSPLISKNIPIEKKSSGIVLSNKRTPDTKGIYEPNEIQKYKPSHIIKDGEEGNFFDIIKITDEYIEFTENEKLYKYKIWKETADDVKDSHGHVVYTVSYRYELVNNKNKKVGFAELTRESDSEWNWYMIVDNNMYMFKSQIIF